MRQRKQGKRYVRLWTVMVAAILLGTVGSGFYRTFAAGDDATYRGLKIFADVIDLVQNNYVDPVDTEDLIHKAIQGMVSSLDPHSQLLPPEAFEELQIDTRGEFGGIGIVITMQKGVLTVISPIEGTPAYEAGVQAGDIIVEVDGESTKDMMLWEAVKKMRGPKGEAVTITIVREGAAKPIEFELVRDIIPIESVRHLTVKPGYGYIRITNFQENTTSDLEAALAALESGETPMKGLILDLRDNPGGLLNQAIQVSDIFLDSGAIVSIKGRLPKHTKVFDAHPDRERHSYPIVVLINGGSASASEIVAGALQDHKRGLILGATSFGKGSVQTLETLRDGYGLKFTIARYYTPSGRSIQAAGIEPDILVKHRFLEPAPEDEGMIKEKDLKNHLEAFPVLEDEEAEEDEMDEEAEEDETGDGVQKRTPRRRSTQNRYGPLDPEGLQTDNQVMRALGILVSYDIFKNFNG